MMYLQAKEHQGLQQTSRSWEEARKHSPLEASKGAWPCQQMDFTLTVSRIRDNAFLLV